MAYLIDPKTNAPLPSPGSVDRRRKVAESMLTNSRSAQPIQHWSQGAAKVADALIGGLQYRKAEEEESKGRSEAQRLVMEAMSSGSPDTQTLMSLAGNEWTNPAQMQIASALWERANTPQERWEPTEMGGMPGQRNTVTGKFDPFPANAGRKTAVVNGRLVDENTGEVISDFSDPKPRNTVVINGRLVDAETGQEIGNFPEAPKPQDPFTLSPGQARYDAEGNLIAGSPTVVDAPEVQEFFDEKTGLPYKAVWNPQAGTWERQGGAKAPSGMQMSVNPETGEVQFQQGVGLKPLTESQSKDTVFVTRATGALPLIDKYGDELTNLSQSMTGGVPVIGNYMKSPEFQQAEQAGKEFLQAILRKDTGAAITAEETAEYGSVYLPRPGDSPEVLAQKRASRNRAVVAIQNGLPPAAILALEKGGTSLVPNEAANISAPPSAPSIPDAGGPPKVTNDADYDALPSGTEFLDPEGVLRRKP